MSVYISDTTSTCRRRRSGAFESEKERKLSRDERRILLSLIVPTETRGIVLPTSNDDRYQIAATRIEETIRKTERERKKERPFDRPVDWR